MDSGQWRYPYASSAVAGLVRMSPMKKQHLVSLPQEHRVTLKSLISSGQVAARTLTRARILLKADTSHEGGGWSDREIGEALETSRPTVERVRKRFAQEGWEAALYPRPRLT